MAELLLLLQRGVGQPAVVLECRCDNLETVYVSPCPSGGVVVSDEGESFGYLARGTDSTYQRLDELDLAAVDVVCQEAGATLRRDDPEEYPLIECAVAPGEAVAGAVARVAEAVDQLFKMAMRSR